ncbi:MAG: excinuclease ABC subunit C, partial [Theionarchaea archaeon]|nr:excinuclease ABC subunit C [Theionarchaea archaeon]
DLGPVSDLSKHVLMSVRDEAHRFAISYHKTLRKKDLTKSILDEVRGIGTKRKKLLMNQFGSVDAMKNLTKEELNSVLRNESVAERVYECLHRGDQPRK